MKLIIRTISVVCFLIPSVGFSKSKQKKENSNVTILKRKDAIKYKIKETRFLLEQTDVKDVKSIKKYTKQLESLYAATKKASK